MATARSRREVVTGATPGVVGPGRPPPRPWVAFWAVLRRDIFVTGKELPSFLAQVLVQPFFFLLVFVVILGRSGFVSPGTGRSCCPA